MSETGAKARGERRAHFRGGMRAGRRVDLRYQRRDGESTRGGERQVLAVTGNIGVGGAFVLSNRPEPVGSELVLAVIMPGQQGEILLDAAVRWVREGEVADGGGMGLKFAPLDVQALLALQDYFSTLDQG